jgi:hypothetical protein
LVVQAAQEHANHASALLEQTKQFADDIRSQVAESRELARVLINAGAGENVRSWGEAEGADGQTPLDSVENDRAARLAAIPAGESPANRGVQSLL